MPHRYQGKTVVDDSLSGVAGKDDACGWAVVQLDVDRVGTSRCGIYGTILVCIDVQRTMSA